MTGFYRGIAGGVELFVRLTPKAAADRIGGVETAADGRSHLAAKVRAVPEKGAANAALERLVAEHFGVGRSKVSVVGGHTARLKTVRIEAAPEFLRPILTGMAKPLI
ncbi:DUF167 family protein [Mesorhizobium sp. LHD-90]|uniref:DUF167 family protein n=1 Tax=Mesorhizobium sp. LHD-90 TaxID=3071414 RepID=UPI0027DEE383|nr:DUF167 family protein [Mesorhizobium sp. LHD-90]MDQ6432584.1 DUF167 family protein [Mesorhizobium sp. LHD-90]